VIEGDDVTDPERRIEVVSVGSFRNLLDEHHTAHGYRLDVVLLTGFAVHGTGYDDTCLGIAEIQGTSVEVVDVVSETQQTCGHHDEGRQFDVEGDLQNDPPSGMTVSPLRTEGIANVRAGTAMENVIPVIPIFSPCRLRIVRSESVL